jgi:hypothetical protein
MFLFRIQAAVKTAPYFALTTDTQTLQYGSDDLYTSKLRTTICVKIYGDSPE